MAPTSHLAPVLFSSSLRQSLRTQAATPQAILLSSRKLLQNPSRNRFPRRATMATKSPAGEAISQVAQAEGGTTKGSASAQMQSELTKQMNSQQGQGMQTDGTSSESAKSPAGEAVSRVAKAEGGTTKGSASAQMQSELSKQMNAQRGTQTDGTSDSAKSPAGEAISQVAQAEGGTTKGSASAQMQSEITKQMNAQQGPQTDGASDSAKSSAGEAISQVAKAEGGTSKGSTSAQMQSEVTKQMNAEGNTQNSGAASAANGSTSLSGSANTQAQGQTIKEENFMRATQDVGAKMQNDPSSVTAEDASYLESRESRAMGGARPPTDSIAAEAKRMAAANEQGTTPGTILSGTQTRSSNDQDNASKRDREANFQALVDVVKPKIENDPDSVTKEEANLLHSREQRAHGHTDKGGIAAQAQKIVAERERASGQVGA